MRKIDAKSLKDGGFTIMELLIATVVFSVVLLIVTYGIIQVSRTYYKGVNETNTQTVARTIMDSIGQSIQFNGDAVAIRTNAVCVGEQLYLYRPGWAVSDAAILAPARHETRHGLYLQDGVSNCATSALPASDLATVSGGTELLSPNMRIANLSVSPDPGNSNQYKITIRVIYGQDDFIYSPSGNAAGPAAADATCKGSSKQAGAANAGTVQFCSVSELSTTVTKRVQ